MPLMWLRDHCRCEECYNAATAQKNVDNYTLNHKLQAVEVHVADDSLTVEWQDGHYSAYSLKWIQKNFHCPGTQVERFLWDGPRMTAEPLPAVAFEQHMNSEEGLKQTLMNILQYGFCVVQGAPVTPKGTETVANRICFLAETVYKRLSIMTSGVLAHSDTAYTNLPLGAHTDTTYYSLPAGIQVFHCLHHDGEGGETLLVDGFNVAEKLRKSNPSYFDTLVRTEVPHECIEKSNYHLYCLGTVQPIRQGPPENCGG
nr:hypothetical protein BaRGS_016512 [Batillaria attramentaria]